MPTVDEALNQTLGAPKSPLNGALDSVFGTRKMALGDGVAEQPDAAAKQQALAKKYGVPVESIKLEQPRYEQRDKTEQLNVILDEFQATGRFMAKPENVAVSHDDIESLTGLERLMQSLGKTVSPLALPFAQAQQNTAAGGQAIGRGAYMVGGAALAGVYRANAGLYGVAQAPLDLLGFDTAAQAVAGLRQQTAGVADKLRPVVDNPYLQSALGGVESVGQSAASLVASMGNPALALSLMGATTGGEAYGEARDQGLPPVQSLTFGAAQAGIEIATERLPVARLFGDIKAGAGFRETIMRQLATEMPGEQAATILQDLNEWAVLPENADKPFAEYLKERPNAALHTAVATAVAAGAQGSIGAAIGAASRKEQAGTEADSGAEIIDAINQTAQASKTAQRAPEAFAAAVEEMAKDADVQDVYISADALNQSGLVDKLAAVSPAVQQQYTEALATGGDVRIPLKEYAARIATSPELSGPLLDHLRTDPDAPSKAEAQAFKEQQGEQIQQDVERLLGEQEQQQAFRDSRQAVIDQYKAELDNAGRFTGDVNEVYASLLGNFYSVLGGKLGITAQEAQQQYPLAITEKGAGNQGFNQLDGDIETIDAFGALVPVNTSDYIGQGTNLLAKELRKRGWELGGLSQSTNRYGQRSDYLTAHNSRGSYSIRISDHVKNENYRTESIWILGSDKKSLEEDIFRALDFIDQNTKERDAKENQISKLIFDNISSAEWMESFLFATRGSDFKRDNRQRKFLEDNNIPDVNGHIVFSTENIEYVKQAKAALSENNFNQNAQAPRGQYNPATQTIALLKSADLSTFLHEAGHAFLDITEKVAMQENAPAELQQDMNTLLGWFGLKGTQAERMAQWQAMSLKQKTPHHEKLAESFERYLLEGKAPNIELAGMFQRMRAWMLSVYRSLKDFLGANPAAGELNKDVRAVFDRLLATPQQIAEAESARSMMPLFSSPEESGLSPEAWADYQRLALGATAEALEKLGARQVADLAKVRELHGKAMVRAHREAASKRKKVRQEVARELMRQPVYAAQRTLQTGKVPTAFRDKLPKAPKEADSSYHNAIQFLALKGGIDPADPMANDLRAALGIDQINQRQARRTGDTRKNNPVVPGAGIKRVFASKEGQGYSLDYAAELLWENGYLASHDLQEMLKRFNDAGGLDGNWMSDAYAGDLGGASEADMFPVDLDAVAEMLGLQSEEFWREAAEQGTLPAEQLAEIFGFASSAEMFAKLAEAPPLGEAVEQQTEQRMLERFGDITSEEALRRAADEAVHNETREKLLLAEMKALRAAAAAGQKVASKVESKKTKEAEKQQAKAESRAARLEKDVAANKDKITALKEEMRQKVAASEYVGLWKKLLAEEKADEKLERQLATKDAANFSKVERLQEQLKEAKFQARKLADEQRDVRRAEKALDAEMRLLADYAKEAAAQRLGRVRIRDINPRQYMAAAARNGKEALKSLKAYNYAAAQLAKRNQLFNTSAARAAVDAQQRVEKALNYLKKFEREGTRKNLDPDYIDQIDALLGSFDLRKGQSLKAIDKRKSLAAWVEGQQAQGIEPDIDPALVEAASRKHYRDMTLEEFGGVIDTVRQIEHLGRLKNKLLKDKKGREIKQAVEAMRASIRDNAKGERPPERETDKRNRLVRWKRNLEQFGYDHRKFWSLASELDGWQDGGPVWEFLVQGQNDAGAMEASMRADAAVKIEALLKRLQKPGMHKRKHFPDIDKSFSREEIIGIALNWGNDVNRERIMTGEQLSFQQVHDLLQRELTGEDALAIQAIWDFLESYRPQIAAKERRLTGKEPAWVQATPAMIGGQTLNGGYYPIHYDPWQSDRSFADSQDEVQKQMQRGLYTKAVTRRGHLKARSESTGRGLRYDLDVLAKHTDQVIRDLAWHEYLTDANKLLSRLEGDIRQYYGSQFYRSMKETLASIALGEIPAQNMVERGLNHIRVGTTIAGMGWRFSTAAIQVTGYSQSIVRIGWQPMMKGFSRWAGNPLQAAEQAYAKSEMMRTRSLTINREVNEVVNRIEQGTWGRMQATAFWMVTKMQSFVDVPTWWGAYEAAMQKPDMTESKAVALADQAVLDAQGGGQLKDLSKVQRGHPLLKLFTNFYSYFNTTLQLATRSAKRTKWNDPASVATMVADMAMLSVVPAMLTVIMREAIQAGGDDDDTLAQKIASETMGYGLGMFIGLREFGSVAQIAAGMDVYDYRGPAGLRFLSELQDFAVQANQGEIDEAFVRKLNNAAGIWFHYPAGQINTSLKGAQALIDGDTKNPLALVGGYRE